MKISKLFYLLLAVLVVDFFFITSNMHAIFDPKKFLFLFIITRIAIIIFGVYVTRKTSNWVYTMLTFGYLFFSFAGVSILHLSYASANI